jgi:plastocyanin
MRSRARKGAVVKRVAVILTALTAALALAACGGSSSSSSSSTSSGAGAAAGSASAAGGGGGGGGGGTVKISADPSGQLKYDTTSLTAKAGTDSFEFTNESPLSHNFTIEDKSGKTVGSTPTFTGGTKSVNLTLQPGTYKFLCTVPGHAAAGMQGTLTVK